MDASMLMVGDNQTRLKVSVLTRLISALSYTIPAIGGAISSFYLMNVMRILKEAETAGVAAVMGGLAEATIPVLGSLYLGIIFGIIVIVVLIARMIMKTETASPSSWFFIICGVLFLVPAALFGEGESLIIEVLTNLRENSEGLAGVASNINLLLISSILAAPVIFIILTILSVLPFSSQKKPKWSPLLTAILIEILLIAVTAAFQLRLLWLYKSVNFY